MVHVELPEFSNITPSSWIFSCLVSSSLIRAILTLACSSRSAAARRSQFACSRRTTKSASSVSRSAPFAVAAHLIKLNDHARESQRSQHSHWRIWNFRNFVMGTVRPEFLTSGATGPNLSLRFSLPCPFMPARRHERFQLLKGHKRGCGVGGLNINSNVGEL